jgi:hypothetical protein
MISNYHLFEDRVDEDVGETVVDSGRLAPLVQEHIFDFSQQKSTKKRVYTTSNGLKIEFNLGCQFLGGNPWSFEKSVPRKMR